VVQFVHRWVITIRHPVFDDPSSLAFLEVCNFELFHINMRFEVLMTEDVDVGLLNCYAMWTCR
jgi:hypothetical protein